VGICYYFASVLRSNYKGWAMILWLLKWLGAVAQCVCNVTGDGGADQAADFLTIAQ
jgi:hypothetical protein